MLKCIIGGERMKKWWYILLGNISNWSSQNYCRVDVPTTKSLHIAYTCTIFMH